MLQQLSVEFTEVQRTFGSEHRNLLFFINILCAVPGCQISSLRCWNNTNVKYICRGKADENTKVKTLTAICFYLFCIFFISLKIIYDNDINLPGAKLNSQLLLKVISQICTISLMEDLIWRKYSFYNNNISKYE